MNLPEPPFYFGHLVESISEDDRRKAFLLEQIKYVVLQLMESRQDDNDLPRRIFLAAVSVILNYQLPSLDSLDLAISPEDIIASLNFTGSDLCVMELYKTVETLTLIHISRFHSKGDQCDLDYAIYLLEIMTQLLDTSTFATFDELHKLYFVLVGMHLIRCYLFDEPVYLDSLNGSYEAFLEETYGRSGYTAYRTMFSFGLAYNLTFHLATTKDCDRVLQLYNDTYSFESGDMCRYWDYLRSNSLQFLSISGRKFHDLTGALECIRVATEVAAYPSHKEHAPKDVQFLMFQLRIAAITGDRDFLLKVGEELKVPASCCRFLTIEVATRELFCNDSDESLNDAIRTLKDRCRTCPEEDPCGRWYSIVVAIALLCRYKRYADDRDIEEAYAFRRPFEADNVLKVDASLYKVSQKAGLSRVNGDRWPTSESVKALACTSQSNMPLGRHFNEDVFFYNDSGTSTFWCRIMDPMMHPDDDVSFHYIHERLLSFCKSSDDPTVPLLSLSGLYLTRYKFNGHIEDLEKGADYFLQVLNTTTVPPEYSRYAIILFELERLKPGSVAPSLLLDRFDCMLERVQNITLPIPDRLHYLRSCHIILLWRLPGLEQSQASHALEIGNLLLSLTEQQCWASPNPHSSLSSRYEHRSLHLSAAKLIILACREDGLFRALEILEMGRSLLWNQLENLRTPPPASVPPDLAADFLYRSRTLERRMGFSHEIATDLPSTHHGQLVKERNNIIEQIRALPGCESFLAPQPFHLLCDAAAAEGPVVLLPSANFAVVMLLTHTALVPLPLTAGHFKKWKDSLRINQLTRDVGSGGLSDDPRAPSTSAARDPRSLRCCKSKMNTSEVLKELWDMVAKPVIDMIEEITVEGTKGKGKASIPKLEERGRIWWCCAGNFSFMPIHAAEIYGGSNPICVSDYYISSYTPTIGALVKARMRPYPTNLKVLAAIQPNPGKGYSQLRNVQEELREIVTVVPPENLISLGDSDQPDFEGIHTTVKNVVDKFSEATVLHLACHGTQDPKDPFKSGFILANGERLTIEEMIKHRFPNAHTAILSACHTSSNDAEQPDESINLSSTLLHLGFSSILATLWPMYDKDGPLVAKSVYSQLCQQSEPTTRAITGFTRLIDRQINATLCRNKIAATSTAKYRDSDECVLQIALPMCSSSGYESRISSMIQDALQPMMEGLNSVDFKAKSLSFLPLAEIVDALARKLRQEGAPPERWATFVHVGI